MFEMMLSSVMVTCAVCMVGSVQVLKGSEDNPSQYMNFMNAVFTAQKQV